MRCAGTEPQIATVQRACHSPVHNYVISIGDWPSQIWRQRRASPFFVCRHPREGVGKGLLSPSPLSLLPSRFTSFKKRNRQVLRNAHTRCRARQNCGVCDAWRESWRAAGHGDTRGTQHGGGNGVACATGGVAAASPRRLHKHLRPFRIRFRCTCTCCCTCCCFSCCCRTCYACCFYDCCCTCACCYCCACYSCRNCCCCCCTGSCTCCATTCTCTNSGATEGAASRAGTTHGSVQAALVDKFGGSDGCVAGS